METQSEPKNTDSTRLILNRICTKNSSFESFSLTLNTLQNPVQPMLEMQVFANVYSQENNMHQAVLGLKIQAKYQSDVLWKVQLEQMGFYTAEGFTKEQEEQILNGFCMNQIYSSASPIVTQMVVQAGFAPIYLQPIDFHQLYQRQKKEVPSSVEATQPVVNSASPPTDLAAAFKQAQEHLSATPETIQ